MMPTRTQLDEAHGSLASMVRAGYRVSVAFGPAGSDPEPICVTWHKPACLSIAQHEKGVDIAVVARKAARAAVSSAADGKGESAA